MRLASALAAAFSLGLMSPTEAALTPLWVGPAFSGSWFTDTRSGEGFTLQILDSGSAEVIWFTYPPAGSAAKQAWIIALDGKLDGDRIRFENAFTTRGPKFGASFDPAQVEIVPWGMIEFQFTGCNEGSFTYAGPAGWGSGTRPLVRLTAVAELECAGKRRLEASGSRALSGLKSRSGAWFDPAHNGEGWQLEELPDGRAQVYWFTYDETGAQAWTLGTASTGGDRIDLESMLQPVGTNFGVDFDPADVRLLPWGRLTLQFDDCLSGVASYASTIPAYGSGSLRPVRLSRLAATTCHATAAAPPLGGTWTQGTPMPAPQSEHAVVPMSGLHCALGGFGDPRAFKCYDLATNSWSRRADVPVGRDHAEAVSLGSEVLFVGGFATDFGPQDIAGWRYRVAEDRWEPVPQLPQAAASGAAVLGNFAYFGTFSGSVHQVNLTTLAVRTIPNASLIARNHSQLVAFQGELWLMGGRYRSGVAHGEVAIFDPASETWRAGPTMAVGRSGFAAAASDSMIIVAGGERLDTSKVLVDVEAIVAGDVLWRTLPSLPFAVHGFGGTLQGNTFIALGGSRGAGGVANEGQVQIYRW
jgi:N-acetylneuraminic acid mutarotase